MTEVDSILARSVAEECPVFITSHSHLLFGCNFKFGTGKRELKHVTNFKEKIRTYFISQITNE